MLVEECRLALKLRHPNVLLTLGLVSDGKSNHGAPPTLPTTTQDAAHVATPPTTTTAMPTHPRLPSGILPV